MVSPRLFTTAAGGIFLGGDMRYEIGDMRCGISVACAFGDGRRRGNARFPKIYKVFTPWRFFFLGECGKIGVNFDGRCGYGTLCDLLRGGL